jgi:hypothetical protein
MLELAVTGVLTPFSTVCVLVCIGRSSPRRLLLAVDASGLVLLLAASSGHMMMTQQITAGRPLAVNVNSESEQGLSVSRDAAVSGCMQLAAGWLGAAAPLI